MKTAGHVVVFCLLCAAAKAVATALLFAICLAVIIGAYTRPRETFGLLGVLIIARLIETQPFALICILAVPALVAALRMP